MGRKKSMRATCSDCGGNINVKKPFALISIVRYAGDGEEEVLEDVAAFHIPCFELIAEEISEGAPEEEEEYEEDEGDLGPTPYGKKTTKEFSRFGKFLEEILEEFQRYYEEEKTKRGYEKVEYRGEKATNKEIEAAAKILGISPDASSQEIKEAYRRRAKETHPDLHKDKDTTEEFKKVMAAYETMMGR